MNTADLEWFGPPERNTLRPLGAVLLESEELGAQSSVCLSVLLRASESPFLCTASASLLYLNGGAYMAAGSPTGGPNDVV